MFWYLLNIFIIIGVSIVQVDNGRYPMPQQQSRKLRIAEEESKRICVVATLNWVILSGFRHYSVGNDTIAYRDFRFLKTMERSWGSILGDFYLKYVEGVKIKDPGYPLLEKVFQIFFDNYTLWLVAIAAFFFILMGKSIYRYSTNPCLSYVLFSTLFYSFFAITGHRQTIATAIVVFWGTEMIAQKRFVPFLLTVAAASTIHMSALCFLPFYWLSKIKLSKMTLSLYWFIIVLSFAFRTQFMIVLQKMVGYESYEFSDRASAGNFMFLMFGVAIFITLFYKPILKDITENLDSYKVKMIELSFNAIFIACIFMSLLLINPAFMRVVQYYSIFLLIVLPTFQFAFTSSSRWIFNGICIAIMVALLIHTRPFYYFVWQKI